MTQSSGARAGSSREKGTAMTGENPRRKAALSYAARSWPVLPLYRITSDGRCHGASAYALALATLGRRSQVLVARSHLGPTGKEPVGGLPGELLH